MKRFFLALVLTSCGSERAVEAPPSAPPQRPAPSTGGAPAGGEDSFADLKSEVLDVSCARCHQTSAFLKTEAAFLGSAAQTRAGNKSMPPASSPEARTLSIADRARIVNFQ